MVFVGILIAKTNTRAFSKHNTIILAFSKNSLKLPDLLGGHSREKTHSLKRNQEEKPIGCGRHGCSAVLFYFIYTVNN